MSRSSKSKSPLYRSHRFAFLKKFNRSGINTSSKGRLAAITVILILMCWLAIRFAPQAFAATFTVANTNDSGAGSLRQAILDANANPGTDTISFNIAGGGVHTISPTSALPTITDPVIIDGYTQPGASANTQSVGNNAVFLIELSGASAGAGVVGLRITAGNSTVRGLVINRFSGGGSSPAAGGITLQTNGGNVVEGNRVGTDPGGTVAQPNNTRAILVLDSTNNRIGGSLPAARNLISGNTGRGITIQANVGNADGNTVQGNYIGTNAAGTLALPNTTFGNGVVVSTANNLIGGPNPGEGNVISGNQQFGIGLSGNNNTVQGNLIGTDATGTAALGNTGFGMQVFPCTGNLIGGPTTGARNIISANGAGGITIFGFSTNGIPTDTSGNTVQGNYIGTDVSGQNPLGNAVHGISLDDGSTDPNNTAANTVRNNVIGGIAPGSSNIIAFNGGDGVNVQGSNTTRNSILSNLISFNVGLGIHLINGGNNNQAPPALTSVSSSGGFISIQGAATGPPNTTGTVQFFANSACDSSGAGEGQIFLGSSTANFDASGSTPANGVTTLTGTLTASQVVTATTTDANNNTSPFSICRSVTTSSFNISGHIVDVSGNNLSGISVSLNGSSTVTTDSNGNYLFANVAAGGNYTVTPSNASFSFSPSSQTFNNLDTNRIANFVGTQTLVSISGNVTDTNNAALSNVTIALTKDGLAAGTVLTDGAGNYSFSNLAVGSNYLVTPAGSFTPANQSFTNLTTNATANFKAAPSIPPQCNTPSFGAATNFAAGSGSSSVAIGDFNGDGKRDLAVSNFNLSNVSILLGSGTGSFSAATNFAVGTNPNFVALGDFNGDGKSDLATSNQNSANVSILLGSGTGSFGAATNLAVGASPREVAIGDFNGDGKSDLVTANFNPNNVSILLGSGTGSFSAATNFASGSGSSPTGVAIGDFNGDGKSDLVTTNQTSNNVSILLGSGTGSFGAPTNFAVGSSPQSVAVGDFNGDGKNDLAVANGATPTSVSILLGSGTGSFGAATNFGVGSGPLSVAIGDFNGDGKSDLATANNVSNNVSILFGSGTGSFSAATNFAVGGNAGCVAIGDFDNDGKSDLATTNPSSSNVSILLNTGATCNTLASLSISGHITGANNSSLANVTVTLAGPITRVTQTDASGNYSFANLTPGGNYSVTLQSSYYVFAPSRADFTSLSSNQTANFTASPLAVPSPTPTPSDNFTSPTRDANKWTLGTQSEPAAAFDARVTTAQINGQLVITPLTQASGLHYNGYVSANAFDLRNGTATVEVVKTAGAGADTIFAIGSDADNFARFMVHAAGGPTSLAPTAKGLDGIELPLDTTVTQLIFQVNVGGQLSSLSIPYDPIQHRFMRFRHEVATNTIAFETSPNNIDFTVQHRVVLEKGVSALTAELSAGTSSPTNPGQAVFDNFSLVTSTFQFSSANYSVGEGGGSILITVMRTGSTASAATVGYATVDGTATQRNKYITAVGTLSFAPGETSKTFTVLIVDNALAEGNETLNLTISSPAGSGLDTPARAVLTIVDNDTVVATVNPLDDPPFFVREQYFDFLNRTPDASGLAFWTNQITECQQPGATCNSDVRRINVSAAFFLSIEFQETGYLVERIYRVAYGSANGTSTLGSNHQLSVPIIRFNEFLPDTQQIGQGVIVGQTGWEQVLENNKQAFLNEFVQRSRFMSAYPAAMSGAQFVDALNANSGNALSVTERNQLVNDLTSGAKTRAQVMRAIAEDNDLKTAESNRAFVLMQYFGYLRRNPNDAPDSDYTGYDFWLGKLNEFNGNFVNAEMVNAFIVSSEYKKRFGP